MQLPELRRARRIAVYLAHGSELSTAPLIERLHRAGRKLFVPVVVEAGRMRFLALPPRAPLRRDVLGLPRPAHSRARCAARRLDVIVLPLVGFDARGMRLGMGGGYYDRALGIAGASRVGHRPLCIGYAYAAQEVAELPADPWDVRLDAVATELRIHRFRPSWAHPQREKDQD
jgi:5-formyltetrahydrofolate cyclo-ligase